MKKLFSYIVCITFAAALFHGLLQGMEGLEEGFAKSFTEGFESTLGEAAGAISRENLEAIASKSLPKDEFVAARSEVENALKQRGLGPEAIENRLAELDAAFEDLASNWGKSFSLDRATGKINLNPTEDFTNALNNLDANFGLTQETFGNLSNKFGGLTTKTFESELVFSPADASIPTAEEVAAADSAKLAARRVQSDFWTESRKLSELKKTKAGIIESTEKGVLPDTKAIDALIKDQTILVDSFGYGTPEGVVTKAWDVATDPLKIAREKLTAKRDPLTKEMNEAEGSVKTARKGVDKATSELNAASNELKAAQDEVNQLKAKEQPLADEDVKKLSDAEGKVKTAEDTIKTKNQELKNALDEYQAAKDNLATAQEAVYTNRTSTLKQSYDIADVDYNLKRSKSADPNAEEVTQAKQRRDEAREALNQDGKVLERVKLKSKSFAQSSLADALKTFAAGVIFMIPGLFLQYWQNKEANDALYCTVSLPQKFGGIWMQIPQSLIKKDDPLKSVFLYIGIKPNSKCTGDMLSEAVCPIEESQETKKTTCGLPDQPKVTADTNFFVSAGASNFEGWGSNPITSSNFSGKMIHLNTGYTFYADGLPVDELTPAQPLLSLKDTNQYGAPASVTGFLRNLASVLSGHVTVEAFNPTGDWGFSFAEGPKTEKEKAAEEPAPKAEKGETYIQSDEILKLINPDVSTGVETQCNVGGLTVSPCAPILQGALVQNISQGIGWPQSSIANVWPLRIRTDAELKALFDVAVSLGVPEKTDEIMPAFGAYVYETSFTKLGQQLNAITSNKQLPDGTPVQPIGDYVVALDASDNIVPLRIPQVGGIGDFPAFALNPKVTKLYSLLDETTTFADGSQQTELIDLKQQVAYQKIMSVQGAQVKPSTRASAQIKNIAGWYKSALKYGPFTVGGKTLTIPKAFADAGTFVYTVDPARQAEGTSGLLEDGGIDYLVALDENKSAVDIGTNREAVKEYVSLVSSRFYDQNLKPYNKQNGHDDVEFNVLKANGSYLVGIPTATNWPPSGFQVVDNLGAKTGPFTTPLHTLFMDADLNPYNYPPALTSFMLTLKQQLGTKVATLIESAFEAAGVTEDMMKSLSGSSDGGKTAWRENLAQLVVNGVTTVAGLITMNDLNTKMQDLLQKISDYKAGNISVDEVKAAQAAYNTAEDKIVTDLQANGTQLGNIGDQLKSQYYTNAPAEFVNALNGVKDQLANVAPKTITTPKTPEDFINEGMIPVPDQWALNSRADATKSAVESEVNTSYTSWKQYMIDTKDQWALYLEKGPFNLTDQIVPVTIEATSIADLKRNVYIYTSPDLPGEFLVIGSGTGDALMGQKFDVLNKAATPYLLSLSTGKYYDVRGDDLSAVADVTPKTPNEALAFVASTFGVSSDDPLYIAIKNSQEVLRLARQEQEFGHVFYRFNLLLDNQDADKAVFVYQDITKIPGARQMDRTKLLSEVPDFFVYGETQDDGSYKWMEMPTILNEKSRLLSLVSGILYDQNGPRGIAQLFDQPGVAKEGIVGNVLQLIADEATKAMGASITIRKELTNAITTRIISEEKAAEEALQEYQVLTKEEQLEKLGYPLLAPADVNGINAAQLEPSPYPNLKLYNGKYYQVTPPETPSTIFDYAVKSKDGTQPEIGILYEITYGTAVTTSIETESGGDLLMQARAAAGVVVAADGSQSLTIPNEQPGIDVTKIKPLPGFADKTISGALYQFKAYDQSAFVLVTPSGKKPYYIDLYSGTAFDTNGKPISKTGAYAKTTVTGKYLLVERETDGTIGRVYYQDDNGIVSEYTLKFGGTNPVDKGTSADGNYQLNQYIFEQRIDSTINLKVVENIPLDPAAGLKAVYQVFEQSALTHDANNNAQLYFNSPQQDFTESGQYRTMQYVKGAPPEAFLTPLDAFVVTSVDAQGNEVDEAVIWDDTKGNVWGGQVVYLPQAGNFVAKNYTYPDFLSGEEKTDTSTMTFKDNLVDDKIKSAYGVTSYYSEITNVDKNETYDYVDRLATISKDNMQKLLKGLGVQPMTDYAGRTRLVKVQSIQAFTTLSLGNLKQFVYQDPNDPRDIVSMVGDQLDFITLRASTSAPTADTKYLYKVGSYTLDDSKFKFYTLVGKDNYIDINTGIGYDVTGKPIALILGSDLVILRDVVTKLGAITIPQCQMAGTCTAGQLEPKINVLSWMGIAPPAKA